MKSFTLAVAVLIAACATTKAPAASGEQSLKQLEEKSQEIAAREQQCIDGTVDRTNDEITRIAAAPDALTDLQIELARNQSEREISQCKGDAERQTDELFAHERTEYQLGAQRERDRSALMVTLMTSRPH